MKSSYEFENFGSTVEFYALPKKVTKNCEKKEHCGLFWKENFDHSKQRLQVVALKHILNKNVQHEKLPFPKFSDI